MNAVRDELESIRQEHESRPNAYRDEYLRISRNEHYAREALAAGMLNALETIAELTVRQQLPLTAQIHEIARAAIAKIRGK